MSKCAGQEETQSSTKKTYHYVVRTFTFEKQQYKVRGHSDEEADKKCDELRAALIAGEDVKQHRNNRNARNKSEVAATPAVKIGPEMLVKDFVPIWLNNKIFLFVRQPDDEPTPHSMLPEQAEMYESYIRIYVIPVIGDMRIGEITSFNLDDILKMARDLGRAYSTMHKIVLCIKRLFKYACSSHVINGDPASGLEVPPSSKNCDKMRAHKRDKWTDLERETVLLVSYKYEYGAVVRFEDRMGFRNTEIAGIRVKDVLFEDRVVAVENPIHLKSNKKGRGKSRRSYRYMGFPESYLDELISLCDGKSPEDYLFSMTKKTGKVSNMTEDFMQRNYNKIRREATSILCGTNIIPSARGIKKMGKEWLAQYKRLEFYCLRHGVSTDLRKAGVPEKIENGCLAHDTVSSAAYFHSDRSDARKAADMLDEYRASQSNALIDRVENSQVSAAS